MKTYPETLLSSSGHAKVSNESLTKSSQEVRCDSLKTLSDRCSLGRRGLGLFSDIFLYRFKSITCKKSGKISNKAQYLINKSLANHWKDNSENWPEFRSFLILVNKFSSLAFNSGNNIKLMWKLHYFIILSRKR